MFEYLSEKLQNVKFASLLDKSLLTYLSENPHEIDLIDTECLQILNELRTKFSGYTGSYKIQLNLLLSHPNKPELRLTLIKRLLNALKIDMSSMGISKVEKFFNSYVLETIFGDDLSSKQEIRLSVAGIQFLQDVYDLSQSNLDLVTDADVQYKSLLVRGDLNEFEMKMNKLNCLLKFMLKDISALEIFEQEADKLIDKIILRNFLELENVFDYSVGIENLMALKQSFPHVKLKKKVMWSFIKPQLFDSKTNLSNEFFFSNYSFFLLIFEKTKYNVNLIDSCLVNCILGYEKRLNEPQIETILDINNNLSLKNELAPVLANYELVQEVLTNNEMPTNETLQCDNLIKTVKKRSRNVANMANQCIFVEMNSVKNLDNEDDYGITVYSNDQVIEMKIVDENAEIAKKSVFRFLFKEDSDKCVLIMVAILVIIFLFGIALALVLSYFI